MAAPAHLAEADVTHFLGDLLELFFERLGFFLLGRRGFELLQLLDCLIELAVLERRACGVGGFGGLHGGTERLKLGVDHPDVVLGLLCGDLGLHLGELGQRFLEINAGLLHLLGLVHQLLDELFQFRVTLRLGQLFEFLQALNSLLGLENDRLDRSGR